MPHSLGSHPLHVESVAWVAERKDVLSTFFLMLYPLGIRTLCPAPRNQEILVDLLYLSPRPYGQAHACHLPCVLLLLDYWPLKRFRLGASDEGQGSPSAPFHLGMVSGKTPLVLFSRRIERYHLHGPEKYRGHEQSGGDFVSCEDRQCPCFLCKLHRKNDLAP